MSSKVSEMESFISMKMIRNTSEMLETHYKKNSSLSIGKMIDMLMTDAENGNEYARKCLSTLISSEYKFWDFALFAVADDAAETIAERYSKACDGYVYIARNESLHGMYKIGFTTKNVEYRLNELSRATGVPTPFEEVLSIEIPNCKKFEKRLHDSLDKYRVNKGREFFSCCLTKIISKLGIEARKYLEEMGMPDYFIEKAPWAESQIEIASVMECENKNCDCFVE